MGEEMMGGGVYLISNKECYLWRVHNDYYFAWITFVVVVVVSFLFGIKYYTIPLYSLGDCYQIFHVQILYTISHHHTKWVK